MYFLPYPSGSALVQLRRSALNVPATALPSGLVSVTCCRAPPVTRTDAGSVGLTFAVLSPGRMLTCACGRGGGVAPPGDPIGAPEQAVSNTAKTSNINTRSMVSAESARIAPRAQPIAGGCHIRDKTR